MSIKNIIFILTIPLLAAGCSVPLPFSTSEGKIGGVYKTTNGGADWVRVNNTITETKNRRGSVETSESADIEAADVRQIIFGKTNLDSKTLIAAGGRKGVYISENEAGAWKNILTGLNVYAVASDPFEGSRIYAGGTLGGTGQILLTEDEGKTWQTVYSDTGSRNNVQTIAVQKDGQLLAAATSNGSVLLSRDKGKSWSFIYQINGEVSQVQWIGTKLLILHTRKGLFLTEDYSSELVNLSAQMTDPATKLYSDFTSQFPAILRPDNFYQMAINKADQNNIYMATDTGIFETKDMGQSWRPIILPIQTTSGAGRTNAVGLSYNPTRLLAAVAGNMHASTNGGQSWEVKTVATGGIIRYILPDPEQSKTIYLGVEKVR